MLMIESPRRVVAPLKCRKVRPRINDERVGRRDDHPADYYTISGLAPIHRALRTQRFLLPVQISTPPSRPSSPPGRPWISSGMASDISTTDLYTLAALPRPLDTAKGCYLTANVWSAANGSKKRKRSEVAVGIDGEGVNIYNVRTNLSRPELRFWCV